jgi:alkaline phosphatase D
MRRDKQTRDTAQFDAAEKTEEATAETSTQTIGIGRRRLLQGLGAGVLLAPGILYGGRDDHLRNPGSDLFTLGVASGDPTAHAVVLWTRLAPDPLNGGGMDERVVPVEWEVATDPGMADVIKRGREFALPRNGHAVRALVTRLPANSWLYYRFRAMGQYSRIGRTRTFPRPRDGIDGMRFAVANCQNYQQGFYPAYADMLERDLDFIVHVGDYIYENGPIGSPIAPGRVHNSPEIFSVEDYRNRYALYKLDPHLQEAHARFPFIVTWDDHEVDNNVAGKIAEEGAPYQDAEFLRRRVNAFRVYSETMPMRPRIRYARGHGISMRLFRKFSFGDLADLHVLDTRQFRSDQACEDGFGSLDPDSVLLESQFGTLYCPEEILAEDRTMLGDEQEAWLAERLASSAARWNILAQGIMVTRWNLAPFANLLLPPQAQIGTLFNVDAWDGYAAAQQRLQNLLADIRPSNPVILTGDIHSAWAADIPASYGSDSADIVAAEFVCTSISSTLSDLNPVATDRTIRATLAPGANDDIRYYNGLFRGYYYCEVDRDRWQTTYRAVGTLEALAEAQAQAALGNNADTSLVPFEDSPVATDAVLSLDSGFNQPGSTEGLKKDFERIPTRG